MSNYNELRRRTTSHFLKWACELAEGWSQKSETAVIINSILAKFSFDELVNDIFMFNNLIQRAIDGWNRSGAYSIITSGKSVLYVDQKRETWHYYDAYTPSHGLTQHELARWDALLTVWEGLK